MKQIKIHDKTFRLYISYEQITSVVENMAEKMNLTRQEKSVVYLYSQWRFMFAASCLSA